MTEIVWGDGPFYTRFVRMKWAGQTVFLVYRGLNDGRRHRPE